MILKNNVMLSSGSIFALRVKKFIMLNSIFDGNIGRDSGAGMYLYVVFVV